MSIDSKPPNAWDEADLQELCDEHRRETQTLEFKRELSLGSDGDRREAERDALGMATGGGGVIIYGIEETTLPDGATAAGTLTPLTDGTLRDRLQRVLDDRGQPRLPFQLHPEAHVTAGGFLLVLEVFGRRRPHQAQDGRYYGRRGTNVRPMQEPEVAEAYRERLLRDVHDRTLDRTTRCVGSACRCGGAGSSGTEAERACTVARGDRRGTASWLDVGCGASNASAAPTS